MFIGAYWTSKHIPVRSRMMYHQCLQQVRWEDGWRRSHRFFFWHLCMDVSENSDTPKSSTLVRFSIINHPFWGTPNFLKQPNGMCFTYPPRMPVQPSGLLHVLVSEIQAKLFLFQWHVESGILGGGFKCVLFSPGSFRKWSELTGAYFSNGLVQSPSR